MVDRTVHMDDVEAVKNLKARYFRMMDTKDWDSMRCVFTDDVVVDTTSFGGTVIRGADQFMAFVRTALETVVMVHHGHMPEIELTSPSTATGIWSMEEVVRWPDGRELRGYGHYHDSYEKASGSWRIKSSTVTCLRVDMSAPEGA